MNREFKPLGRHQPDIVEPKYSEVMKSGKYDNVMNYFGESVAHYGKKDAQTYFAETSFQNDCESVLKRHALFSLLFY